ncbi:MAG: preprotein translocase subunit SecA, partial [Chloroflexi bacterium]
EGAHLVTTNDYLAKTGAGWMGPIYHALGMSVAYIAHDKSAIYDPAVELDAVDPRHRHWRDVTRREAYLADITYGQNSEFGFDYLRDNMIDDLAHVVQRDLHYAIVDEADSILIDEARTPLIISSPAEDATETYYRYASVAAKLNEESDYVVDEKHRSATLTDDGITRAEHLLGIQNMYEGDVTAVHYLDNAVKAKALYLKDREYVVKDGEVVIVDEFTGRLMPGRRWSDGLHQAVEAKERVKIQRETRTYATITIQNYFRMYDKLAGMTGTAATEAEEIYKVYKLEVTVIPTNKPMVRKDDPDLVYKTEQGKWDALVRDVKERNTRGQPVLIGTTSVDKSQRLSDELRRHGLKHEVLNAKNHEREALIIAGAGQQGAITVSTNMAGRGVDILLGEGVKELGGLHVIGTERHEARRIDNQLRGRSGRQGDPGNTRFYNSLEDDLIRIFASDRIAGLMTRLGFDDAAPIESGMVTGAITQAQIKVETRNFDIRKRALEFDDVLNNQRNVIYSERRKILEKGDVHETVLGYLHDEAAGIVDAEATSTDAEDWDVEKIAQLLGALLGRADLTKKDFGEITSQDALGDRVAQLVDETYEKREQELGPEISRAVERWVMLRTIDTHWIEHLTAMEELREGIYLRGYGQQDPLVAYKREAHDFFEQMRARIAGGVAQTIMRVSVRTAEQAEQEEQQKNTTSTSGNGKSATGRTDLRTNRDAPGGNGQTTQTGGPQKLGRNDPCWCGSGKKFKKCHGR